MTTRTTKPIIAARATHDNAGVEIVTVTDHKAVAVTLSTDEARKLGWQLIGEAQTAERRRYA